MTLARMLAVATVLVGATLGFAVPASADQVMQGVYSYDQGDIHAEWTIYPSCVPTVGDLRDNLELPVACRLHVAPTPSTQVAGGDARLTGGVWEFQNRILDGIICADGSRALVLETYQFDDLTMTGTRTVSNSNVCGNQVPAKLAKYPFTLKFEHELPIPVDQYPLYCEPGGLKRCF
ncbi:hypothetical protein [Mycolicibacterium sp. 050158]|jgi:hypothetical protein|uniref:hypothetical protein n=1 Tax=Mycolicibacterium sp. 050158 TaxID=3090602 RepID=UPI00299DFC6C|nr:hypothetical protein [Mycolicibacterium sp. 050158]MDX1891105.1 hypothetical protein [Mycolicibacterium sp. 050158]